MKKIAPSHLQNFYNVLSLIERTFPLDRENIRHVIEVKGKSQFPPRHGSGTVLAVTKEVRDQCLPLIPLISITSEPNHLSNTTGILELKIMDSRLNPGVTINYIAWISVFPSGRMVFGMSGAHIDSSGKKVVVEESAVRYDNKFFNDNKLIQTLRRAMVEAFQSEDEYAVEAKARVLKAFDSPLPENN